MPAAGAAAAAAVLAAGAFLVVPAVTPFLMVPMTVRFAAGAGAGAAVLGAVAPVLLFTTVAVLPSLDSLTPLALRVVRDDAGALPAAAAAPLLARVAGGGAGPPLVDELVVEDVVVFRAVAAARVDRAFSTMLLRMLEEDPVLLGDTGLAMSDLPGEAAARSRGGANMRELDVVGESTWLGLLLLPLMAAAAAAPPRSFFFGLSILSVSFSLSPPDMSSLIGRVRLDSGLYGRGWVHEPKTLEWAARGRERSAGDGHSMEASTPRGIYVLLRNRRVSDCRRSSAGFLLLF